MDNPEPLQSVDSVHKLGISVYDDSEEENEPVESDEERLSKASHEGKMEDGLGESENIADGEPSETDNGEGEGGNENPAETNEVEVEPTENTDETTNTTEDYNNQEDFLEFRNNTTETELTNEPTQDNMGEVDVETETNAGETTNGVDNEEYQETIDEGESTQYAEENDLPSSRSNAPNKTDTVRFAGVELVRSEQLKKPFLGGWKHKETGVEYHNASTQTYRPPTEREIRKRNMLKFHREAQTVDVAYKATQPKRESSTQMTKTGLYVSEDTDKVLVPRPYFTADELHELKIRKAVKIQCMVRSFFAKTRVRRLRAEKEQRQQAIYEQQEAKRQEAAEQRVTEIDRRRNPRTKEDFDILYRELEAWRKQETARIESQKLSKEERKAAMYALLQKETKLLQTIDKLKQNAGQVNRELKIADNLDKMSNAKEWSGLGGQATTVVETPFTKRAQELRDLYNALKTPLMTIDQRLDVLLHVKWTVKEFDCRLSRDIIELIDREADLLSRGRSEQSVEGLRQRILSLFLQFIETPEFNPEAARLKFTPSASTAVK